VPWPRNPPQPISWIDTEHSALCTGSFAQTGIEAFDVAVLPWAAALDVSGLCPNPNSSNPVLHSLGDEPRAVVGADIPRMPRMMNGSDKTSITSIALSLRATRIARHS
jgi:hypothetical protein